MDSSTIIPIAIAIAVIVILVVALAALFLGRRQRTDRLRSRFGPEYERVVDETGDRREAEAELRDRQERVSRFDIRPLTASDRERFVTSWRLIQAEFVDQPRTALIKADDLLTEVMRTRGYPVEDFEQRSADLSVDHPEVVQNYREGRNITRRYRRGDADTEDMRQAMIHYRTLFDELVGDVAESARRRVS
jgi:hypothetical protein